jgi:hypothetical protein
MFEGTPTSTIMLPFILEYWNNTKDSGHNKKQHKKADT